MTTRSDTPQRLLARAIEVIDAHGETAIRIRDVAGHVGVTAPIVYKAFGSREGLIVAAHRERYLRSWRNDPFLQLQVISTSTTIDELKAGIRAAQAAAFTPERAHHRRVRVEVLGASMSNTALADEVRKAILEVRDYFVAVFEGLRASGLVRTDFDIPAAVMWYLGQVDGRVLIESVTPDVDGAKWNEFMLRVAFFVLFGDS